MLELCEGLAVLQQNEKQSVLQMLERESKREKNLEARAKEMRQKEKRQAETHGTESDKGKAPWEDQVKQIEEEFWSIVNEVDKEEGGGGEA